ncbi:MAG: anthranilate synthase component I family protein [Chitinophagaceae bacterium]
MTRTFSSFSINGYPDLKDKLLAWAASFPVCCLLDTFGYDLPNHSYDMLIGAGAAKSFSSGEDFFPSLSAFDAGTKDWIFGHIGYDACRQDRESFYRDNNGSGFGDVYLFVPEIVVQLHGDTLSIGVLQYSANDVLKDIIATVLPPEKKYHVQLLPRVSHKDFIDTVVALQQHIHRGDCYEINYCQEVFVESLDADPADLYRQLTAISPNPFSSFYKVHDQYALCASPERYMKKTNDKIMSQPIKGTAPRAPHDAQLDERNRLQLLHSEKDRRENVIVVDLVRNDLSRVCLPGTVVVDELFGIYSFPTVYQMISTVSGRLEPGQDFAHVLEATFPMGSMTGAPKKKVLELIDRYEVVNRGLYSGTIGYIDPDKNFDFNVVIRTIMYNRKTGYMNYFSGAGITSLSDPESEYEECLLKASAVNRLFNPRNQ